jgi:signal transduction histidine kinase
VDRSLHGIAWAAETLAETLTAPDEPDGVELLRPRLRELASIARHAISETRCVVYDLREDKLSAPLGDALRNLATVWSAGSGVPVTVAVPPGTDTSRDSRRELVAIAREALRNVETHAHASRVRISLREATQRLLLTISDNGEGFAIPTTPESLQAAACYGLIGMTERATKLGGTLVITSRPGSGTRIAVQVPAAP